MLGTIGMTLLGMVLWQATEAPDIAGEWTGEDWGAVVLEAKPAGQYQGSYKDTDPAKSGTMQLKWSRVERRFNGTWEEGDQHSGKISLRLVGDEIRGAWTTSKDSPKTTGTARLADLLWKRSSKYSAKLPNGVEVELAGVAFANAAGPDGSRRRKEEVWWRADGTKLDAPPFKLFSVLMDENATVFREFAIQLTSPRGESLITAHHLRWSPQPKPGIGGVGGWVTDARTLREQERSSKQVQASVYQVQSSAGFDEEQPVAVHVIISDQPLGSAWLIGLDGKPLPQSPADATTTALRKHIQIVRIEDLQTGTILRYKLSPDFEDWTEWEVRAIDKKGEGHLDFGGKGPDARAARTTSDGHGQLFQLPAADTSHFEIRLRPMIYKVTFENVSLVPGQKTDVKVKVEPVEMLALNMLSGMSSTTSPQSVGNSLRGQITLVDTERKVAWINLGAADSVKPGMRFEVRANAPKGAKDRAPVVKGSVEIIRIIGLHNSEVRILKEDSEDELTADDDVIGIDKVQASDNAKAEGKPQAGPMPGGTPTGKREGDDSLEGVWEQVLPPDEEAKIPEEQRYHMVFAGDWFAAFQGSQRISASRFKVEPQHTPKRILDINLGSGASLEFDELVPARGIYEIKNGRLRFNFVPDTEALPTKFGIEHPEHKRVNGKLAQEQLDALKLYSKQAKTTDASEAPTQQETEAAARFQSVTHLQKKLTAKIPDGLWGGLAMACESR